MQKIERRTFLAGIPAIIAGPLAAGSQQVGKTAKIGVLSPAVGRNAVLDVFEQSLQGLGWVKNQNISIEVRYSAGRQDVVAPLAAELVGLGLDVLVAWGPDGALAAKRATSQIPVVILSAGDPVQLGLVSTLAHPGGNITGISSFASPELHAKRLELLKESAPFVSSIAVLVASDVRTTLESKRAMTAAGKALRLELREIEMKVPYGAGGHYIELEATIRKAKDQGAQALYVWPSGFTFSFAKQFCELALANRLPSMHGFSESVTAGGLLSYATSLTDIAQRGAAYVDKILKGARPADLPVEQPTRFELVVNLKTAKALGLTIPQSLLYRADQIIQ